MGLINKVRHQAEDLISFSGNKKAVATKAATEGTHLGFKLGILPEELLYLFLDPVGPKDQDARLLKQGSPPGQMKPFGFGGL